VAHKITEARKKEVEEAKAS